jgi:predicted DNA binding CopG/RHH family protein
MTNDNTPQKRQTTFRLWADNEVEIKHLSEQRGLSYSRLINVIVAEYIAKEKAKQHPLSNMQMWEDDKSGS